MELTVEAPAGFRLPERLDRRALAALRAWTDGLGDQPVVVVRGASEQTFCRGLSFDEKGALDPATRDDGLADFEAAVLALASSSTRSVACVRGDAMGGGLGIASACDVVIAAESVRFGLPEPLFGLIPGLVLPPIRARIGGPALRRLALGGESIDAREALRLGLVDEVVSPEALEGRVSVWVRRLGRAEPGAVLRLKSWLADLDHLEREVARGRQHLVELLGSEVVQRRVSRYQRGLAPWREDDGEP
jgi:enoyl-CoA hydratase/carnithine racemase